MHRTLKNAISGSAAAALLGCAAMTLSGQAQAGPLAVAPAAQVAPAPLVETVQFGPRARGARVFAVRHSSPRYVRYGYRRGGGFWPGAAFGLIAGAALGASYGSYGYACDPYAYPYDWSWGWNACPTYATYYPGYWGAGYYPVYRSRRIVYRHAHRRPVVYTRGYVAHRSFAPRVRHVTHHARPMARIRR